MRVDSITMIANPVREQPQRVLAEQHWSRLRPGGAAPVAATRFVVAVRVTARSTTSCRVS